jgi:hypothetical protein
MRLATLALHRDAQCRRTTVFLSMLLGMEHRRLKKPSKVPFVVTCQYATVARAEARNIDCLNVLDNFSSRAPGHRADTYIPSPPHLYRPRRAVSLDLLGDSPARTLFLCRQVPLTVEVL